MREIKSWRYFEIIYISREEVWYLEKVGERSLPLRLLFSQVHGYGKVVYEAAINVKYNSFAKTRDEYIPQLLVLVPGSHAFR